MEFYRTDEKNLLFNFSPKNFKIKRKIQLWKKTDFKNIRKMRKDIGDDGVILMKSSVEKTILKFNQYIEHIHDVVKGM